MTGRVKNSAQKKLYGVKQCIEHQEYDEDKVSGDYQSLADWSLSYVMRDATYEDPDVVVHVGDYLYRQGPCPMYQWCSAINESSGPETADKQYPGEWGDNWNGWYSDFFEPSLQLLNNAPWIAIRGNHETCVRGGHGFFIFMSPLKLPDTWTQNDCHDHSDIYAVPFAHEQFLVMDDSAIKPKDGGIDHMDFHHTCPPKVDEPEPQSRYLDHKQNETGSKARALIGEQIEYFTKQMSKLKNLSRTHKTNFLSTHRPLFAIACNGNSYITMDWTLQEAWKKDKSVFGRVSAVISGHMHWFQGIHFKNNGLPAQFVVGNGGTKLLKGTKEKPMGLSDFSNLTVHSEAIRESTVHKRYGFTTMTRGVRYHSKGHAWEGEDGGDGRERRCTFPHDLLKEYCDKTKIEPIKSNDYDVTAWYTHPNGPYPLWSTTVSQGPREDRGGRLHANPTKETMAMPVPAAIGVQPGGVARGVSSVLLLCGLGAVAVAGGCMLLLRKPSLANDYQTPFLRLSEQ